MRRVPRMSSLLALLVAPAIALGVATPALTAPGGPREAIQVSGHWVIEVRNPDGTVAERREFHNAFTGGFFISEVLTARRSPSHWEISLGGVGGTGPCSVSCIITEPRSTRPVAPAIFKNLTTSVADSGLELRGFVVASQNGSIGVVNTRLLTCNPTSAPGAICSPARVADISGTTLQSPVSVVNGQQVLVTVTISFSSGS